MSDPVRLCDAIAGLLPALGPAVGPRTHHCPVMQVVTYCTSREASDPPTAGVSQAAAPAPALLAPAAPGPRCSWVAPSRSSGQARGGGPG
jgi:hypothetical protein